MLAKIGAVTAGVVAIIALWATAAGAHVTVSPAALPQGTDDAILTFRVPNESTTASVVGLKIQFPLAHPIVVLNPEANSGWTVAVHTHDPSQTNYYRRRHLYDHGLGDRLERGVNPRWSVRRIQRAGSGPPNRNRAADLQGGAALQRWHNGQLDSGADQGGARPSAPGSNVGAHRTWQGRCIGLDGHDRACGRRWYNERPGVGGRQWTGHCRPDPRRLCRRRCAAGHLAGTTPNI